CVASVAAGRKDVTFQIRVRATQLYDFEKKQIFDADRVIGYAEFPGTGGGAPENIAATLNRGGGLSSTTSNADAGPDGGAQDQNGPYAAGRFVCEIFMDGNLEGSAVFNVLVAPCPDASIIPTALCYKFVDGDAVCP